MEPSINKIILLSVQWKKSKININFTITNETIDNVLVVFKYAESIATFKINNGTKVYTFKITPQKNCVIYVVGGNYTTRLENVTPINSTDNSYTINCEGDIAMTLKIQL